MDQSWNGKCDAMLSLNKFKYYIKKSSTLRHNVSSVPFLQRLLNKDILEKKMSLKRLFGNETKKPKKKKFINKDAIVEIIQSHE